MDKGELAVYTMFLIVPISGFWLAACYGLIPYERGKNIVIFFVGLLVLSVVYMRLAY